MAGKRASIAIKILGDESPLRKSLQRAGKDVDSFASKFGGKAKKMAKRIGTVGAALAGAFGTAAFAAGWKRLQGLEEANVRLSQMGLTAEQVESQMDGLLRVLKGTPYALDEGATALAGFVSAGVPLEQTERMLTRVADAAAFGQAPLSEMAEIFQTIVLNGRVTTRELNRLSHRGIPIFAMLADAMGVPQEELRKLVSQGKITAEDFGRYWDEAAKGFGEANIVIEGAAKSAGTTVRGAWGNAMAAMGRLGARVMEPIYSRLPAWIGAATTQIDNLTAAVGPMVDAFVESAFVKDLLDGLADAIENFSLESLADRFRGTFTELREGFQGFIEAFKTGGGEVSRSGFAGSLERLGGIARRFLDIAVDLWPAIRDIGASLAEASASIGFSTWQLLLSVLEVVAVLAETVLVPALQGLSSWMRDNQPLVTGMVAAFTGWRIVSSVTTWVKGLVKAVKGLTIVSTVSKAFTAAGGGLAGLKAGMLAIMGPVGWVIAGIAALAAGIYFAYQRFDGFRNVVDTVGRFLRDVFMAALEAVRNWWDTNGPAIIDAARTVWEGIKTGAEFVWQVLSTVFQAISGIITGVIVPVFLFLAGVAKAIFDGISAAIETAWGIIEPIFNAIQTYIIGPLVFVLQVLLATGLLVFAAIGKAIEVFWNTIGQPIFNNVKTFIERLVLPAFRTARSVAETVFRAIGSAISTFWRNAQPVLRTFQSVVSTVMGAVRRAIDTTISTFRRIAGGIRSALSGVGSAIKAPFEAAFNGVKRLWNNSIGKISFTVPSWVPHFGGKGWSFPKMHLGGTVTRLPGEGSEVMRLLKVGETVRTPQQELALQNELRRRLPPPSTATMVEVHFHGPVARDSVAWVADQVEEAVRRGKSLPRLRKALS